MSGPGLGALLKARRNQIIVGLIFGAGALVLALWGVPLADVADAVGSAHLAWLIPPALIFLLQQVLRAWRQALILQATHPEHRFRTSLSVLCVSFFFINTLPARLGEFVRPLLLLERDGIPIGGGFAMVFVERAIDLCAMLIMIGLVAWLVPVPSHTLVIQGHEIDWVQLGRTAAGTAMPIILLALMGVLFGGHRLLARLRGMAGRLGPGGRPRKFVELVLGFGESFVEGLQGIRQPGRLAGILALTAATWTLTAWMYPPTARAFGVGEFIGFGEGVGILGITMLGMTVPSAPGFAGTYEAFVRAALALFGVSGDGPANLPGAPSMDAVAVAFALTFHWWQYAVQSATAIWFLVVDRFDVGRLISQLAREEGLSEAPTAADRA